MPRGSLTRSQRLALRASRILYSSLATLCAALVVSVFALTPTASDKPVVTVYAAADCTECEQWTAYLQQRGFQVVPGSADRGKEIRRELRLPVGFHSSVIATVNGLYISGFVPVREVHKLRRGKLGRGVIGVAVNEGSALPWKAPSTGVRVLTVFAVLPDGILRPVKVYHRSAWGGAWVTDDY